MIHEIENPTAQPRMTTHKKDQTPHFNVTSHANALMITVLQYLTTPSDSKKLVDRTPINPGTILEDFSCFLARVISKYAHKEIPIDECITAGSRISLFVIIQMLDGLFKHCKERRKLNREAKMFVKLHFLPIEKDLRIAQLKEAPVMLQQNNQELNRIVEVIVERWQVLYKRSELGSGEPSNKDSRVSEFSLMSENVPAGMGGGLNDTYEVLDPAAEDDDFSFTPKSTLIPLKYPFTVPGGRFRESYYWDSFWIMDGQLSCKMYKTVYTSLLNFIDLIKLYGFIPNGTRTYYTNRSQPPYFCMMVMNFYNRAPRKYQKKIINGQFIETMEAEYSFWMSKRGAEFEYNNKKITLNQYRVKTDCPRPESITEDIATFKELLDSREVVLNADAALQIIKNALSEMNTGVLAGPEIDEKNIPVDTSSIDDVVSIQNETEHILYGHIKAACESGWDFSSRFFEDGTNMYTICTNDLIPVDLNAILYKNELIISTFYKLIDNETKSEEYRLKAETRSETINSTLWKNNCWYDYNLNTKKHNESRFYFSNLMPLFYGIKPPSSSIYKILLNSFDYLFAFPGGIPVSSEGDSQQQWDFPNVFAPHQEIAVTFLLSIDERTMACHVASSFYRSVSACFGNGNLYEKYQCENSDLPGQRGEYKCQKGFGWTNGVIMRFIELFGDDLVKSIGEHERNLEDIKKYLTEKCEIEDIK